MMSLQQLVDGSRAFIMDCKEASCGHILFDDPIIPEELLKCSEQLMFSIDMTTDSLMFLIENKQVWDATILLRSVLDGSARFCYLLSAKTRQDEDLRLHEFSKLLPRAEMGGIEQGTGNGYALLLATRQLVGHAQRLVFLWFQSDILQCLVFDHPEMG